jgi:hypothetical protein
MATVMAVRVATGFSDDRDFRAVNEVARTAAATMMETKTAKPLRAKLLWLKSISSPLIYNYSNGHVLI